MAVSKQAARKFDGQRFNLRKLNELQVRKQYQTEITNRLAVLENLSDGEDINRAWENIKENIKTSPTEGLGLYELKQHKPRFDEECLGFLDQSKQANKQWVQDPRQSSVDNLNNVRREVSRHFRNKEKGNLEAKIGYIETNSKINSIRGLHRNVSDFKKGCQPRTNIVKDEKGDLVADSHSIEAWWMDHSSQLLNVHGG